MPPVSQRTVFTALLCAVFFAGGVLWLPSMLGLLAPAFALSPEQLGRLASSELAGMLLGTLFVSNQVPARAHRWVLVGALVLIAINGWLYFSLNSAPPLAARFFTGFGTGIAFGYTLKMCALSPTPTRNFGLFTGALSAGMILGFQGFAYLSALHRDAAGLLPTSDLRLVARQGFGIYALLAMVAVALALVARPDAPTAIHNAPTGAGSNVPLHSRRSAVVLGLTAIALAFVGQGSIYSFMQVLGSSHGFSVTGVANAMSAFAAAGVAGSLAAALTPSVWSRWPPMTAAWLLLLGGLFALFAPASLGWYVAGCAAGGFYWNYVLPLLLGQLAQADPSGRGSVLGGTLSTAGSALGPLLAGQLVVGTNFRPVGWLVAALCLASLLCAWVLQKQTDRPLTVSSNS